MPQEIASPAAPLEGTASTPASGAAPVKPGGVFDDLRLPVPAASKGGVEGAESPVEGPEDGGIQGGETVPEKPAKLFAGRFKSAEDLERAYQESSREGLRLYEHVRALQAEAQERAAKLAEFEEELKSAKAAPAFQELSPEELKALHERDPLKATEYLADKKIRERDLKAAQERQKTERAEWLRQTEAVKRGIMRRSEEMKSDPERYPGYADLQPVMEEILDRTGDELAGKPWTPDVLFLAAKGLEALRAHGQSKEDAGKALEAAKAKAAADAKNAGTGGAGGTSTAPKEPTGDLNDDEYSKRLIAVGPKRYFGS